MFMGYNKNNEKTEKFSFWNLSSNRDIKNPGMELLVTFSKTLMHLTKENLIVFLFFSLVF